MKVIHTQGTCGGVEQCVELAPDYFTVDDDGLIRLVRSDIGEEDLARVAEAVDGCPTGALRLAKNTEV
jgi:ferredoxin